MLVHASVFTSLTFLISPRTSAAARSSRQGQPFVSDVPTSILLPLRLRMPSHFRLRSRHEPPRLLSTASSMRLFGACSSLSVRPVTVTTTVAPSSRTAPILTSAPIILGAFSLTVTPSPATSTTFLSSNIYERYYSTSEGPVGTSCQPIVQRSKLNYDENI